MRVVAVVVTHNRRDLLSESVSALYAQTRVPDAVVIVDNASADGTAALVRERFGAADLVRLARNVGGAGGFAVGIARALEHRADAIWLLDDDAVAAPEALAALLAVAPGRALVASRVVWTDGRDHPMNTPRALRRRTAPGGCAAIRSASFVSVLVDATAVRECGLPIADYFLWNDDFEYTLRLLRGRTGLLCRSSLVVHKTASADVDLGRRFFHEVRNKVWLFTRSRCLAPGERLLYAASTLRRWSSAIARSADRRRLLGELARGLRAGLRAGPRPNAAVLGHLGVTCTDSDSRRSRHPPSESLGS